MSVFSITASDELECPKHFPKIVTHSEHVQFVTIFFTSCFSKETGTVLICPCKACLGVDSILFLGI